MNLLIENVPEDLVARLRRRAEKHRRSLGKELLAIIEQAVGGPEILTIDEVLARVRRLGVRTPPEAASIVRAYRDRN
jgi:plasmid stability protein